MNAVVSHLSMEAVTVTDTHVYFWHEPAPFANWTYSPFKMRGHEFATAEMGMMWLKAQLFHDSDTAAKILRAKSAKSCKALGRKVAGFDEAIWVAHREEIMEEVLMNKFTQNADLGAHLAATGARTIVEASPLDKIWGIGLSVENILAVGEDEKKWRGLNLLGRALMRVRARLG